MTDWRTAPICYVYEGKNVVDDRGEVLVEEYSPPWREFFSHLFSRNRTPGTQVRDPSGQALFYFDYKRGDFRSWLKIMDLEGSVVARIDRKKSAFRFKSSFIIRDAFGVDIGRIENPQSNREFIVFDNEDRRIARGVFRALDVWEVRREGESDGYWPEIVVAFFLCVFSLTHAPT